MRKTLLNKRSTILSSNDIIYKFLNDDLERFFKRFYRYDNFQMVYSKLLPEWEKYDPDFVYKIKNFSRYKYPGYISRVCNILRIMHDHYDFHLDFEDYQICEQIENVLGDKFDKYRHDKDIKIKSQKLAGHTNKGIKKKDAIKEMLAQGFIEVNDFEEFDKHCAHVMSSKNIQNVRLIYPENFMYSHSNMKVFRYAGMRPHVYSVYQMLGIRGFCRISTPETR